MFALLGSPLTSKDRPEAQQGIKQHGPRALVVCPTRELAGQIYNECMKLAQGRKWNILLFSKGASSSGQKKATGKVGMRLSSWTDWFMVENHRFSAVTRRGHRNTFTYIGRNPRGSNSARQVSQFQANNSIQANSSLMGVSPVSNTLSWMKRTTF